MSEQGKKFRKELEILLIFIVRQNGLIVENPEVKIKLLERKQNIGRRHGIVLALLLHCIEIESASDRCKVADLVSDVNERIEFAVSVHSTSEGIASTGDIVIEIEDTPSVVQNRKRDWVEEIYMSVWKWHIRSLTHLLQLDVVISLTLNFRLAEPETIRCNGVWKVADVVLRRPMRVMLVVPRSADKIISFIESCKNIVHQITAKDDIAVEMHNLIVGNRPNDLCPQHRCPKVSLVKCLGDRIVV